MTGKGGVAEQLGATDAELEMADAETKRMLLALNHDVGRGTW
jgi:hypothetical protein